MAHDVAREIVKLLSGGDDDDIPNVFIDTGDAARLMAWRSHWTSFRAYANYNAFVEDCPTVPAVGIARYYRGMIKRTDGTRLTYCDFRTHDGIVAFMLAATDPDVKLIFGDSDYQLRPIQYEQGPREEYVVVDCETPARQQGRLYRVTPSRIDIPRDTSFVPGTYVIWRRGKGLNDFPFTRVCETVEDVLCSMRRDHTLYFLRVNSKP